EPYAFGL
uniref:Carcinustatin-3 n=1 Tax=Carcinus maenas TaxID=6759 RepID=ALL3_CARMA|nr:RecName: Full=Carcinustatin-3 [Carcinus maenas]